LLFDVDAFAPTCERLVRAGGQLFATTGDDVVDGCDVEGNMLRISAAIRP